MRILLSTFGSRGDVHPLVALALQLRALDHEVHLCVPPDFREWIESVGLAVTPIGPEVRTLAAAKTATPTPPPPLTPEQRQQVANAMVATQFETITAVAQRCDIIVGATAVQIAAPSIAEKLGIAYIFAAYAPTVLPSEHHPPPGVPTVPGQPPLSTSDHRELWVWDTVRFHNLFGGAVNAHRASLGLAPVSDVRSHMFTDRPWLAADPTLAPWPDPADEQVVQTGAWIRRTIVLSRASWKRFSRRATDLFRIRQRARTAECGPGDARAPCAETPGDHVADWSEVSWVTTRWTAYPSAKSTCRPSFAAWPPSSIMAALERRPPPHSRVLRRSSFPTCTTSITGRGKFSDSASALHSHREHRARTR